MLEVVVNKQYLYKFYVYNMENTSVATSLTLVKIPSPK